MADENEQEAPEKKGGLMSGMIMTIIVGVVSGGIGLAVPILFPGLVGISSTAPEAKEPNFLFLPFGETVVNLNEGRLNRYLKIATTLQVEADAKREAELTELLEKHKTVLASWMLSHLADLAMDDIRGKAGQNRLRREIQDHFAEVLFPDGEDVIHDVLFEEFNIQ